MYNSFPLLWILERGFFTKGQIRNVVLDQSEQLFPLFLFFRLFSISDNLLTGSPNSNVPRTLHTRLQWLVSKKGKSHFQFYRKRIVWLFWKLLDSCMRLYYKMLSEVNTKYKLFLFFFFSEKYISRELKVGAE